MLGKMAALNFLALRWGLGIFCLTAFLAASAADEMEETPADPPKTLAAYEPTSNYTVRAVQGWRIRISPSLMVQSNLCERAVKELDHQLEMVSDRLPAPAVQRLRQVAIWLELTNQARGGVYHPAREWLILHGQNPDMARSVVLGNARNLVEWPRWQPFMVMHELAHAWHHQVLGYDYKPVLNAYRQAVESKTYEQVLQIQGQTKRHYGLNNPQEFFAESTEAYFGVNDFYPFVKPELKVHDPETFRVVEEAWKQTPK